MNPEVLQAANEWGLWVISASIIAVVLLQAILYARLSFKVAKEINYPALKCREALKVGMITAIGPSVAIFIVMVGMMSVLGAPLTWMRLATIGAAPTEMTAATVGAQAVGVEFGSPEYSLHTLSTSIWTMTINSAGWLVLVALFAHRLEGIRSTLGGGDTRWLAILSMAAAVGCFGYLNANTGIVAFRNVQREIAQAAGPIYAMLGGLAAMIVLLNLAKKLTWLREYTLGIAMLVGMGVAVLFH